MKLTQKIMDRVNELVTKTIAKELNIKEEEVPNWISIAWNVADDGITRYFVSGSIDDVALKEVGKILLDMCDQLAQMGHLPKIKLYRDPVEPNKMYEGRHEFGTEGCKTCKGKGGGKTGHCTGCENNEVPMPWGRYDKKKWN